MATELPVFEANRAVRSSSGGWPSSRAGAIASRPTAWGGCAASARSPSCDVDLIADRHWEFRSGPPDDPADRFGDYQFPNHFAFAGAIEDITHRPWREVVKLTGAERRRLRLDSRGCDGAFAAHWLLHELDGAPLPSRRANTAWRHRCEPFWPAASRRGQRPESEIRLHSGRACVLGATAYFRLRTLEADREAAAEVEVLAAVEQTVPSCSCSTETPTG